MSIQASMLSTLADKSWTALHVTGNKILFLLDSGDNFSALTIFSSLNFQSLILLPGTDSKPN